MKDIVFKIQDKELETAEKFIKKHRASCGAKYNLTLGEYFTYTFIPTGLGAAIKGDYIVTLYYYIITIV